MNRSSDALTMSRSWIRCPWVLVGISHGHWRKDTGVSCRCGLQAGHKRDHVCPHGYAGYESGTWELPEVPRIESMGPADEFGKPDTPHGAVDQLWSTGSRASPHAGNASRPSQPVSLSYGEGAMSDSMPGGSP